MKASSGKRQPKGNGWGGARPGAGRKPNPEGAGVRHLKRERVERGHPVQVMLRVEDDVPDLRTKVVTEVIREAVEEANDRFGFRVLEHRVERERITLIVQARSTAALSRGMKGFNVRFARNLNRVLVRTGRVLADRFDSQNLSSKDARRRAVVRS